MGTPFYRIADAALQKAGRQVNRVRARAPASEPLRERSLTMGISQRRREQRAKKSALKEARMKSPGKDSKYARKLRGIYPPRSPYLTGDWGPVQKIDNFFTPAPVEVLPW